MRTRAWRSSLLGWVIPLIGVVAPHSALAQGIFTCTDAKGRKLTADRPIADCLDREQKELNASGTVKRKLGPVLTAVEVAQAEEKAKLAAEERVRAVEARQRDRALLGRYPDQASHDRDRARALAPFERDLESASQRLDELQQRRVKRSQEEHKRLTGRFDEELGRLQALWQVQASAPSNR